ncbi:MAG TPA: PspC domain-containing protein [Candidatus Aminicenantes bacterium]|nr:PspC domain-containing protein [Candidatus Aminicenantes bacterium]
MKRLYRSRKDRVISGICGGIGEYFNLDPVLVRVGAVLLVFTGGVGLIAYIAGIFIIPEQPLDSEEETVSMHREESSPRELSTENESDSETASHSGPVVFGLILVILGAFFLLRNIPLFNDYYWWIRNHLRMFFWPGIFIGLGVFLIARNYRR